MSYGFVIDFDRAAVRLMRASDDLDERGFARAVFAEQRVDFARTKVKGHLLERAHRAEGFCHGRKLEERFQTILLRFRILAGFGRNVFFAR